MDKDLPELSSEHSNSTAKRRPLILDLLDDGGSVDVGNTTFKLNRRRAEILTQIGDSMVELAVNRDMEARVKARKPLMGGELEFEANRNSEGGHRFNLQFRKQFSTAK